MEYYLSSFLLILIGFSSFCTSVVNYLSHEELNNIILRNYKSAQYLQQLRLEFETNIVSFSMIEFGLLIFYGASTSYMIFSLFPDFLTASLIFLVIMIITITIRYISQALGMKHANAVAEKISVFIYYYSRLIRPLYFTITKITEMIVGNSNDDLGRDDINSIVESAHEDGAIDADEYRILRNIMNFSDVYVGDVMTPRTVLFTLESDITIEQALNYQEIKMYSRIPIWEGESIDDNLVGYVLSKDIYQAALAGKTNVKIREYSRELTTINEEAPLDSALELLLNKRQHLFIVVDEYGGVIGLITMEDVLETILGVEIVDEADRFVDLRHLAKQKRDERISGLNIKNDE